MELVGLNAKANKIQLYNFCIFLHWHSLSDLREFNHLTYIALKNETYCSNINLTLPVIMAFTFAERKFCCLFRVTRDIYKTCLGKIYRQ